MMNDSTSMSHLRRFVDTANEGIWSLDENLRIDFVNARMTALMGYTQEELLGHPLEDFIFEDDLGDHHQHMAACRRGVGEHYQWRFRHHDGTPLWGQVSSTAIRDDDGQFIGSYFILNRLAECNRVEEETTHSEQNLADYLANIEGFFYTFRMTPEGRFFFPYASPGIEKLYGLKPEDVYEDMTPLHTLAHPDDRPQIDAAIAESARTMTPFRSEFRVCRPGEPEHWIEARSIPHQEADGGILWYGLMLDIDERKQNEQKVALLNFALNKVHEAAFLIDEDARFHFVNEEACRQLGYQREEMLLMGVADIDPDFPIERWAEAWARLKKERSLLFESHHQTKDGVVFPVEINANLIEFEQQYYNLALVRDIRGRKQVEDALRLACDAAQEANQAKSLFLDNMSHELRTPLTAILGFSSLLHEASNLTESQRKSVDIINQSGEQLFGLLNDVLEITRIESGKLQLEVTPFDLDEMVNSVYEMMHLRAQRKGLQLVLDQSSRVPRYIRGDEARIRQILVNLVGNAVKFTEQGGVALRLDITTNADYHLLIEVEDNGPGITAENQQRLFRPFVQFIRGAALSGTGLGLSITHHLVQLMAGEISVKSQLGKGSLFRVELPFEPTGEEEVRRLAEVERGSVIGLAPGQPACRILIAGEQYDNQLLLTQLMHNIGLESKPVVDAEQCVRGYRDWQPDLIWMDLPMTARDGIEATRRIRGLPGGEKVKIVAVTTSVFQAQQSEFRDAGVDEVVFKPYRITEIYDCLARQLGLKFIYSPIPVTEHAEDEALTPERLAKLPQTLLLELEKELVSLNSEHIVSIVDRISEIDPGSGRILRRLADDYNYPKILAMLSKLECQL